MCFSRNQSIRIEKEKWIFLENTLLFLEVYIVIQIRSLSLFDMQQPHPAAALPSHFWKDQSDFLVCKKESKQASSLPSYSLFWTLLDPVNFVRAPRVRRLVV